MIKKLRIFSCQKLSQAKECTFKHKTNQNYCWGMFTERKTLTKKLANILKMLQSINHFIKKKSVNIKKRRTKTRATPTTSQTEDGKSKMGLQNLVIMKSKSKMRQKTMTKRLLPMSRFGSGPGSI